MNRLKRILRSKIFIVAVAAVLVYTLAGFFLLPYLVRHYVPKTVQAELRKQAAIGEVRFNPYTFEFEANDFRLEEPGGQPIAGFKRLFVDFELKSILNRAWTFREVGIEAPLVNALLAADGSLNLAELAPASAAPAARKEEGPPPRLIIEQVWIDQGRVDFTDRRQSQPAAVTLAPLNLKIENLTTLPDQKGPKTITAKSGDGESLSWTGQVSLNPLATQGNLKLENIRAATLWKFIRDEVNLEPPLGTLNLTTDYTLDLGGPEPQVAISQLAAALNGVALRLAGAEAAFLELPEVKISEAAFDLGERQAGIGRLTVSGGRARLAVDEDGTLNLERIVKAPAAPPAAAASAPGASASKPWRVRLAAFALDRFALDYRDASRSPGLAAGIDAIAVGLKASAEAGGAATQAVVDQIAVSLSGLRAGLAGTTEPAVRVDKVALTGGAYDLAPNTLTVEKLSVEGGALDLKREADGSINLAVLAAPPEKGAIAREATEAAAEGHPFRFLINTVAVAGLGAAFSDLSVKPEEPLLNLEEIAAVLTHVDGTSPMKFEAGLTIREGGQVKASGTMDPSLPSVDAEVLVGELALKAFQPYIGQAAAVVLTSGAFSTRGSLRHGIKASGAETLYQGGFRIDNLRLVEPGAKETLVGWRTVQTDQLKLQLAPNGLEIGDLRVVQPSGKFIIEKDGSLNLANVIKPGPEPKQPAPADAADPFPFRVRRVLVSDGRVDFADLSLFTPFGTKIHELKGIVAGVASSPNARAQVKLDGRVDEYGTARIDGELNTSDPKAFTNIGLAFRNLEMSRLTPYSGKFAGRKIDSGKLTVDLKYKIDKARLAGENQIVVERLKLGGKVESPDAVDLPLDFAIALLEDSNGVIDLGLPVSGNLDSPEFSFGALIWKALGNLLTKIVTSPFRALGALLPGGSEESFQRVAFEPGRADVPPPEKEKLNKLAGALQKRPQLKLTVQGRYNPETDLAELRSAGLRRALAARQGLKIEPGVDPGPVDYSSPETGKTLAAMFAERFGADALEALHAQLKAADEIAGKQAAAKPAAAAPVGETRDPGQAAKTLFRRLAEAEPVGEPELAGLAAARSRSIAAELSGPGGIPAERVALSPPAAMDKEKEAPPTAVLNLEASR
ncbi:MAG: DUF748 domain-containing protein [Desulfobacterales bacterium]|jgi:uncharacterized protein involved in outer membrane biogenesis|nr:DUF748 domain-containing protein [Desulfobacterales bacterium]